MHPNQHRNPAPATLMDVAKRAGVSIATASRVLNGSTRKVRNDSYAKVMAAAKKLNYLPNTYAQAVAKGTAPNIVLLVSDISDPYFAAVSQGVLKKADEYGVSVTIAVAPNAQSELDGVRKAISSRPRGIIISESEYTNASEREALQEELQRYEATGGHTVFMLNRDMPFPTIEVANEAGAVAITRLLLNFGYSRPAILHGADDHRSSNERLQGVLKTLQRASINTDPTVIVNGGFNRTDGYAAVMQLNRDGLLNQGPHAAYAGRGIDSIIALNDVMAIGAMAALRTCHIEPGKTVGVTGFGDIPYAPDVYPALTTVHLPLQEMGQAAMDSVIAEHGHACDEAHRLIFVQSTPDIVLRDSLPHR